jgi:hypothetical protein
MILEDLPSPEKPQLSFFAKALIGFAIFFIVIISFSGNHGSDTSASEDTGAPIEVSSSDLAVTYDHNEAYGDSEYKGKQLLVTGVIQEILKNHSDDTVLVLNGMSDSLGVRAYLNESEESKAIHLSPGEKITVQCRGKGEVLGSAVLDKCKIRQ